MSEGRLLLTVVVSVSAIHASKAPSTMGHVLRGLRAKSSVRAEQMPCLSPPVGLLENQVGGRGPRGCSCTARARGLAAGAASRWPCTESVWVRGRSGVRKSVLTHVSEVSLTSRAM